MRRFPFSRFRLPPFLLDTRHLNEASRYDLLSRTIPDFIFSEENPLIWQNELRYPYFAAHLGEVKGKRVADLGCGWGFLLRKFAADGACAIGLDLSAETLRLAAVKLGSNRQSVPLLKGRAEELPLVCAFDLVTATDVLEHVDDLDEVIREASRILKPGGKFAFVTVNRTILARLVYITLGEIWLKLLPRGTHRFDKFIPPQYLNQLLAKNGLILEDMRGILVNPIMKRYHFWPSRAIEYIGIARKV